MSLFSEFAEDVIDLVAQHRAPVGQHCRGRRCRTGRRRRFVSPSHFRRRQSSNLGLDVALVVIVVVEVELGVEVEVVARDVSVVPVTLPGVAFRRRPRDRGLGLGGAQEAVVELSDDSVEKIEGTPDVVTGKE